MTTYAWRPPQPQGELRDGHGPLRCRARGQGKRPVFPRVAKPSAPWRGAPRWERVAILGQLPYTEDRSFGIASLQAMLPKSWPGTATREARPSASQQSLRLPWALRPRSGAPGPFATRFPSDRGARAHPRHSPGEDVRAFLTPLPPSLSLGRAPGCHHVWQGPPSLHACSLCPLAGRAPPCRQPLLHGLPGSYAAGIGRLLSFLRAGGGSLPSSYGLEVSWPKPGLTRAARGALCWLDGGTPRTLS